VLVMCLNGEYLFVDLWEDDWFVYGGEVYWMGCE